MDSQSHLRRDKPGQGTRELVQQYFRAKRRQLLAMSDQAVVEHNGLRGSYREELQRIYLREILPGRFSVGQGMVYGVIQRSKEADIVIWDSANYPSLPLVNHALFLPSRFALSWNRKASGQMTSSQTYWKNVDQCVI